MKSVKIHGNDYVMVNERIKFFRENYENGAILTDLIHNKDGQCIFKAEVLVEGECVATGWAEEKVNSSTVNKTSYIENCETSAVGRALGLMGIGIDKSIASAEEVDYAIQQQQFLKSQESNDVQGAVAMSDISANSPDGYDDDAHTVNKKQYTWADFRNNMFGGSGKNAHNTWAELEEGYLLWLIYLFPETDIGKTDGGNKKTMYAINEKNFRRNNGEWDLEKEKEYKIKYGVK